MLCLLLCYGTTCLVQSSLHILWASSPFPLGFVPSSLSIASGLVLVSPPTRSSAVPPRDARCSLYLPWESRVGSTRTARVRFKEGGWGSPQQSPSTSQLGRIRRRKAPFLPSRPRPSVLRSTRKIGRRTRRRRGREEAWWERKRRNPRVGGTCFFFFGLTHTRRVWCGAAACARIRRNTQPRGVLDRHEESQG